MNLAWKWYCLKSNTCRFFREFPPALVWALQGNIDRITRCHGDWAVWSDKGDAVDSTIWGAITTIISWDKNKPAFYAKLEDQAANPLKYARWSEWAKQTNTRECSLTSPMDCSHSRDKDHGPEPSMHNYEHGNFPL